MAVISRGMGAAFQPVLCQDRTHFWLSAPEALSQQPASDLLEQGSLSCSGREAGDAHQEQQLIRCHVTDYCGRKG